MIDLDFLDMTAEQGGLSVVVLDDQPELTELEVEEKLARLSELNAEITAAQKRRDNFQSHYREKILKAEQNFETDTAEMRAEMDSLMTGLRRYAETHITGKTKHLKFPSGKLCLTKRDPQFFIGGVAVTNDNPTLIEIARKLDAELVKTQEVAAWGELKKRLEVDDNGNVCVKETGEVIPDMRARIEPDKFSVKPA